MYRKKGESPKSGIIPGTFFHTPFTAFFFSLGERRSDSFRSCRKWNFSRERLFSRSPAAALPAGHTHRRGEEEEEEKKAEEWGEGLTSQTDAHKHARREKVAAWTAEDFPLQQCVCKCHFQPASPLFQKSIFSRSACCLVCVSLNVASHLAFSHLEKVLVWDVHWSVSSVSASSKRLPTCLLPGTTQLLFRLRSSQMLNLLSAESSKLAASSPSSLQRCVTLH